MSSSCDKNKTERAEPLSRKLSQPGEDFTEKARKKERKEMDQRREREQPQREREKYVERCR